MRLAVFWLPLMLCAAEPITYTLRAPNPADHLAMIEALVPTDGRASIDLLMPVWSPGYYREEDHASRVKNLAAHAEDGGAALTVEKPAPNRWRIATNGARRIRLTYSLLCNGRSVMTSWIGDEFVVLNGGPTFITLAEKTPRPHDIRLELPKSFRRVMTALPTAPDQAPNHFRAPDFETVVDSPIVAGDLRAIEFVVGVKKHQLVTVGDIGKWKRAKAMTDLQAMIRTARQFWGALPYPQYLFLFVFRSGGGGLEHKNSTLITSGDKAPTGTDESYWSLLGLASHEYTHAYIGKRLRPVELGPFDWDHGPRTSGLWIIEGLTEYYSDVLLTRSGVYSQEDLLGEISSEIAALQKSPGRLKQSVEQSSLDVWTGSANSGVDSSPDTVSYYGKGEVLGFLLDARIRKATGGRKSLDDVIRLAYERYAGERGFTADQFRETAEEATKLNLRRWFSENVSSPGELDYEEALEWYGLRFTNHKDWKLVVRNDATPIQKRRRQAWVSAAQ